MAPAFRQVVRLGASWPILFTCLCLYTPQLLAASAFSVFALAIFPCSHGRTSVPAAASWHHSLSGITLASRAIRSQHYTLFNSNKLVRPPRLLCRCRPPHESHMVQPAHRSHSVLPVHRFRWAPPALSQVTFCQLRSLRLPRSSPLLHSWIVASLLMLPRRPSCPSPYHLWMPLCRLFHTSLPRDVSTQLSFREFLASPSTHHVLCPACDRPAPRYLLMRLYRRLKTASQLMMPPHNYRSRSSSSGASSPMTL